ncbi:hypothetical protein SK128_017665 [Halocaridina rubra]|uniref:Uncharacterized protein n=1 Tax=Halocaridina rubra TaxID=373956 RepID=A0AAN8WRS0_HALRR
MYPRIPRLYLPASRQISDDIRYSWLSEISSPQLKEKICLYSDGKHLLLRDFNIYVIYDEYNSMIVCKN